jgi:hypothetical protein
MQFFRSRIVRAFAASAFLASVFLAAVAILTAIGAPHAEAQSPSSASKPPAQKTPSSSHSDSLADGSLLNPVSVSNGIYRNSGFGFSCQIPPAWVQRTDEMNARDESDAAGAPKKDSGGRVLLAAFSRPPQARAEDVNSSIVIAAESVSTYPGLKDAAQYFGPLTEVTKAQGFAQDGEPYEFAVGAKTLARADFQKDVGTRVMRQSTLVMLAHGYAVSFTFLGGTEDEVEELIGGLNFAAAAKPRHP